MSPSFLGFDPLVRATCSWFRAGHQVVVGDQGQTLGAEDIPVQTVT